MLKWNKSVAWTKLNLKWRQVVRWRNVRSCQNAEVAIAIKTDRDSDGFALQQKHFVSGQLK